MQIGACTHANLQTRLLRSTHARRTAARNSRGMKKFTRYKDDLGDDEDLLGHNKTDTRDGDGPRQKSPRVEMMEYVARALHAFSKGGNCYGY